MTQEEVAICADSVLHQKLSIAPIYWDVDFSINRQPARMRSLVLAIFGALLLTGRNRRFDCKLGATQSGHSLVAFL